jgi:Na+-transporting NADH:ubiquinone oxidoreductase subunit A
MARHKVTRGIRLPLAGEPVQAVEAAAPPRRVAVLAADAVGLRPTMHAAPGDSVVRGQVLFTDKRTPEVRYTAPSAGTVVGVHRGARRALESVVIETSRAEREGREPEAARFPAFSGRHPTGMTADDVRALLLESGQWTALRARPYGRVADPGGRPHSIFVTAIDTNPLAPSMDAVVGDDRVPAFHRGLAALERLTDGAIHVCTGPDTRLRVQVSDRVRHEVFVGPHPAGTVGLHIHTLDAVDRRKVVWHVGVQDVVATGRLFETGQLDTARVVSLGGPPVTRPRLLRTRLGASTAGLVAGELASDREVRVISGSVFGGRAAAGEVHGYLGRYHQQISVLVEGREREFLGWLRPGFDRFSAVPTFASAWLPRRRLALNTSTHGSPRAIVPIGAYERVMPLDLPATPMMRALAMRDVERAAELGCLELDEEDVALCTFVDAGKAEFGPHLRSVLDELEKEG